MPVSVDALSGTSWKRGWWHFLGSDGGEEEGEHRSDPRGIKKMTRHRTARARSQQLAVPRDTEVVCGRQNESWRGPTRMPVAAVVQAFSGAAVDSHSGGISMRLTRLRIAERSVALQIVGTCDAWGEGAGPRA
jgi:hypothetical protein